MKRFRMINVFVFIFLIQLIVPLNLSKANQEDVYDVILFWGQSNMVGFAGMNEDEGYPDKRYDYTNEESVTEFSKKTGIDQEILSNSVQIAWTKVQQVPHTAYEYQYSTNSLVELTDEVNKIGERLCYNNTSGKLKTTGITSLIRSYGTNMIPQFCKTYYEKTGHKVVAVFCAYGGKEIQRFLPPTDTEHINEDGDTQGWKLYESIVCKYNAAIDYMNENGYKVGNKMYVCFQGEADCMYHTSKENYKRRFKAVHDALEKSLGITKGAIVESAYQVGLSYYPDAVTIHTAQLELINENSDIIKGSSFAWDRYVPNREAYNDSTFNNQLFIGSDGNKLSYEEARDIANAIVCYPNNIIHFTSAALSQIGKEVAISIANTIDTKAPVIENVEDGKVYEKVTPIIKDDNLETVSLSKNNVILENYKNGDEIIEEGDYVLTAKDKYENTTIVSFKIVIKLTPTDIVNVKRHIVKLQTLTIKEIKKYDRNEDGAITTTDLVKIKRKIVGLE